MSAPSSHRHVPPSASAEGKYSGFLAAQHTFDSLTDLIKHLTIGSQNQKRDALIEYSWLTEMFPCESNESDDPAQVLLEAITAHSLPSPADCRIELLHGQAEFQQNMNRLRTCIPPFRQCISEIENNSDKAGETPFPISQLALQLDYVQKSTNDMNRILVCGDSGAGKSVFLNCLFGVELMPSQDRDSTSVIVEISYGPKLQLRVRNLANDFTVQQMCIYDRVEPDEVVAISPDDAWVPVEDDATLQPQLDAAWEFAMKSPEERNRLIQGCKAANQELPKTPAMVLDPYLARDPRGNALQRYLRARLTCPIEFLRNLCFVDTPGFNTHVVFTHSVLQEAMYCSAFICIVDCVLSQTLKDALRVLRERTECDPQTFFFVQTHLDTISEQYREDKRLGIKTTLDTLLPGWNKNHVIEVQALQAHEKWFQHGQASLQWQNAVRELNRFFSRLWEFQLVRGLHLLQATYSTLAAFHRMRSGHAHSSVEQNSKRLAEVQKQFDEYDELDKVMMVRVNEVIQKGMDVMENDLTSYLQPGVESTSSPSSSSSSSSSGTSASHVPIIRGPVLFGRGFGDSKKPQSRFEDNFFKYYSARLGKFELLNSNLSSVKDCVTFTHDWILGLVRDVLVKFLDERLAQLRDNVQAVIRHDAIRMRIVFKSAQQAIVKTFGKELLAHFKDASFPPPLPLKVVSVSHGLNGSRSALSLARSFILLSKQDTDATVNRIRENPVTLGRLLSMYSRGEIRHGDVPGSPNEEFEIVDYPAIYQRAPAATEQDDIGAGHEPGAEHWIVSTAEDMAQFALKRLRPPRPQKTYTLSELKAAGPHSEAIRLANELSSLILLSLRSQAANTAKLAVRNSALASCGDSIKNSERELMNNERLARRVRELTPIESQISNAESSQEWNQARLATLNMLEKKHLQQELATRFYSWAMSRDEIDWNVPAIELAPHVDVRRLISNKKEVAIKSVSITELKDCIRLHREVQLLRCLSHPNVISLAGAFVNDSSDTINLVMPRLSTSLEQIVRLTALGTSKENYKGELFVGARKALDRPEGDFKLEKPNVVRNILLKIAFGLQSVHNHKIIHRDLKLSNVLVDASSGQVLVADFDAGAHLDWTMERTRSTTPMYRAPEMWPQDDVDESKEHGPEVDVWSFGCLAFRLMCPTRDLVEEVRYQLAVEKGEKLAKAAGDLRLANEKAQDISQKKQIIDQDVFDAIRDSDVVQRLLKRTRPAPTRKLTLLLNGCLQHKPAERSSMLDIILLLLGENVDPFPIATPSSANYVSEYISRLRDQSAWQFKLAQRRMNCIGIISFDSGGARTIVQSIIVEHLCKRLHETQRHLLFAQNLLLAGSGMGGVLALMLRRHYLHFIASSPSTVLEGGQDTKYETCPVTSSCEYMRKSLIPQVFEKSRATSFSVAYRPDVLRTELRKWLEHLPQIPPSSALAVPSDSKITIPNRSAFPTAFVVSCNSQHQLWTLRTHAADDPVSHFGLQVSDDSATFYNMACATMAADGYFIQHEESSPTDASAGSSQPDWLHGRSGYGRGHPLVGWSNPCMLALWEALSLHRTRFPRRPSSPMNISRPTDRDSSSSSLQPRRSRPQTPIGMPSTANSPPVVEVSSGSNSPNTSPQRISRASSFSLEASLPVAEATDLPENFVDSWPLRFVLSIGCGYLEDGNLPSNLSRIPQAETNQTPLNSSLNSSPPLPKSTSIEGTTMNRSVSDSTSSTSSSEASTSDLPYNPEAKHAPHPSFVSHANLEREDLRRHSDECEGIHVAVREECRHRHLPYIRLNPPLKREFTLGHCDEKTLQELALVTTDYLEGEGKVLVDEFITLLLLTSPETEPLSTGSTQSTPPSASELPRRQPSQDFDIDFNIDFNETKSSN